MTSPARKKQPKFRLRRRKAGLLGTEYRKADNYMRRQIRKNDMTNRGRRNMNVEGSVCKQSMGKQILGSRNAYCLIIRGISTRTSI